jgi:hypothetical protein
VLPFEPVSANTGVALTRFLKTRGMTTPTLHADKVTWVQNVLAHELDRSKQGDLFPARLRCPDGTSMHKWLLERRPELAGRFPQLDDKHKAPEGDGWISDLEVIQRVAPVLNQVTMRRYYEPKIRAPGGETKVWSGGYRRVVNRTHIISFKYHPPTEDQPQLCWVRYHCPASMRKNGYNVTVCMSCFPATEAAEGLPAECATVCDVKAVACGCPAGADGECIHGCATLWVLYNLARAGDAAREAPSASRQCRWNQPGGGGEAYDSTQALAYMPFTKDDPEKPVKRDCAARSSTAARMIFSAYSDRAAVAAAVAAAAAAAASAEAEVWAAVATAAGGGIGAAAAAL